MVIAKLFIIYVVEVRKVSYVFKGYLNFICVDNCFQIIDAYLHKLAANADKTILINIMTVIAGR